MKIDSKRVTDIEFDGIDHNDYPDYCDAYISGASILDGKEWRKATSEELELINENGREWIYEKLIEWIF